MSPDSTRLCLCLCLLIILAIEKNGWIERLEVSSKKKSVVWTDEEAMSISGCLRDRLQPWTGVSHGCLGDRVQAWTEATERCFVVSS
ncbi:hypothetical protein DY000_02028843 [Brassica cretica]|uniref:Myb-like domain-containing protein n=1 Tax=Brassica cretica TaxID=69181 RepID=A0ABQ7DT20_BRACR|nr:hypothetical protein DY000_02028843 [Brassica cretica]